jgi:pyruvate kinase
VRPNYLNQRRYSETACNRLEALENREYFAKEMGKQFVLHRERTPLPHEMMNNGTGLATSVIEDVLRDLTAIRREMDVEAAVPQALLDSVHDNYRESARNLLHYLALRRHDLRPLQLRLAALGLSSLGRAESSVLATIDAVLEVLHRLAPGDRIAGEKEPEFDFIKGQQLLAQHTEALLGRATPGRGVRIMVTMPSEAAHEYTLVQHLVQQGMNCMRINCAHDDAIAWLGMIDNMRRAERALGQSCRVVMDLAGPKLRTGPMEPGPAVVRISPKRDVYGRVTAPARVWLTSATSPRQPPTSADASLPLPEPWMSRLRKGEQISIRDARDARRAFLVVDVTEEGCWAETEKTCYVIPGTVLRHEGRGREESRTRNKRNQSRADREAPVGDLVARENAFPLNPGDVLVVTRDLKPGRPATLDSDGRVLTPARIGCTIPEVFENVRTGESIWFDDGKIGGVIEKVEKHRVGVRITQTRLGGGKLRADKGINLPESDLQLGAMTRQDIENLSFVAQHADVVELSFANTAHDVEQLQQHLERLQNRRPAIVLKIETRRGFENLPDMLLTAMRWPCCGVMIARGDLAVECGFERLAEVQEEILWISEAAHIPVIWATQVLETLAKEGMPSRAEITDAAMGHRAECVMLNKGPHVLSAVRVLDDILRRMQTHQAKKRAMLRELRLAHTLPAEPAAWAQKSREGF